MYVPKVFAVEDVPRLHDFMDEFSFATLVTQRDGELTFKSPKLIEAFDEQVQSVAGDFWSYHWFALVAS